MKQFTDSKSRVWDIDINVDSLDLVRSLTGINLYTILEVSVLEELGNNPKKLVDVIYVLCKEQADSRNVSDTDFGRSMRGDAIDEASIALLEELIDFFPKARRLVLRKIVDKTKQSRAQMVATLEAMSKKMDELSLDQLNTLAPIRPNLGSGSAPELSESTPAD